jgi:hypothetical protein
LVVSSRAHRRFEEVGHATACSASVADSLWR